MKSDLDPLAAYRIAREPNYRAVGEESALFDAAFALRMPLMLKGPHRLRQELRGAHGVATRQSPSSFTRRVTWSTPVTPRDQD